METKKSLNVLNIVFHSTSVGNLTYEGHLKVPTGGVGGGRDGDGTDGLSTHCTSKESLILGDMV